MNAPHEIPGLTQDLFGTQHAREPGELFEALWKGYRATLAGYSAALKQLSVTESAEAPCKEYLLAIRGLDNYDVQKMLDKVAIRIWDRLVRLASERFSTAGMSLLEIDTATLLEKHPGSAEALDPKAIWAWLSAHYGGETGRQIAWAQSAERIRKAFGMRNHPEVNRQGGYTLLSRRSWSEQRFSGGGWQLGSSSSIEHVRALLSLADFATWDNRIQLRQDLVRHVSQSGHTFEVASRQKIGFGVRSAEVVVVMFKERVDYRLRDDVAERLQIFLGSFPDSDEGSGHE